MGLTYAEHESGYVVGYLAAEKAKIAGRQADHRRRRRPEDPAGRPLDRRLQHCAKKADPGIKVLNAYSQSFTDQDKCKSIAQNQISQGAQVLFQVAGGCGLGALDAADAAGIWGIGVDADQSYDAKRILTSGVKQVDDGVFETIKQVEDD